MITIVKIRFRCWFCWPRRVHKREGTLIVIIISIVSPTQVQMPISLSHKQKEEGASLIAASSLILGHYWGLWWQEEEKEEEKLLKILVTPAALNLRINIQRISTIACLHIFVDGLLIFCDIWNIEVTINNSVSSFLCHYWGLWILLFEDCSRKDFQPELAVPTWHNELRHVQYVPLSC